MYTCVCVCVCVCQNNAGALFERMGDTLSACRIKPLTRIVFEAGEPLKANEWQLQFRIVTGNKQTPTGGGKDAVKSKMMQIVVPSDISCEELKLRAITHAGLDGAEASRRRIRTVTAFFEEGSGLVRRSGCALPCFVAPAILTRCVMAGGQIRNENNRVSKELDNGDIFWVEEGTVPRKSEVEVNMRVWTPELARLVEVDETHLPGHALSYVPALGGRGLPAR